MRKVIIGIDQSYKDTGISIFIDKNLYKLCHLGKKANESNSFFREKLRDFLIDEINGVCAYCFEDNEKPNFEIITERIRLKSNGHVSDGYIKSTAALVATVIDVGEEFDIPVYSVDTRAWKTAIVGTSKPKNNRYGIDANKYPTILYMKKIGLLGEIVEPYKGRGKKGVIKVRYRDGQVRACKVNDNIADAYCIGLYGYEKERKLVMESF